MCESSWDKGNGEDPKDVFQVCTDQKSDETGKPTGVCVAMYSKDGSTAAHPFFANVYCGDTKDKNSGRMIVQGNTHDATWAGCFH